MSEPTDFSSEYAKMGEGELLAIARDYQDLTQSAQAAIRDEFAKRHMEPPLINGEPELGWRHLVTAECFRELPEAMVAKSMLESAGVPCWLFDENLVRIGSWCYSEVIGGIRLQVQRKDEADAKKLLAQRVPDEIRYSDSDKSYQQPRCPACGSRQIGKPSTFEAIRVGADTWQCSDCGARWPRTDD